MYYCYSGAQTRHCPIGPFESIGSAIEDIKGSNKAFIYTVFGVNDELIDQIGSKPNAYNVGRYIHHSPTVKTVIK
jgi:hypothetical protein